MSCLKALLPSSTSGASLHLVPISCCAVRASESVISLRIDPRSVDVNVHPTKKEVHFLNEDTITERIADAIQQALIGQSQSRVFEYQVEEAAKLILNLPPDDRSRIDSIDRRDC